VRARVGRLLAGDPAKSLGRSSMGAILGALGLRVIVAVGVAEDQASPHAVEVDQSSPRQALILVVWKAPFRRQQRVGPERSCGPVGGHVTGGAVGPSTRGGRRRGGGLGRRREVRPLLTTPAMAMLRLPSPLNIQVGSTPWTNHDMSAAWKTSFWLEE
jgi:hypothetical protein